MRKTKLRPGKGAKASILTKYIKPNRFVPNKDHRTEIILDERFVDASEKGRYRFRIIEEENKEGVATHHASTRFVKVIEEGDVEGLFDDPEEEGEGKIPWGDSKAKKVLYDAVRNGSIPLAARVSKENGESMSLEEIYASTPEYAAYDYEKFSSRLSAIRKKIQTLKARANDDKAALDDFVSSHEVFLFSYKDYIQWQGSQSQELAQQDLKDNLHVTLFYRELFNKRPE